MNDIEEKAIQKLYEYRQGYFTEYGGIMVFADSTIYEDGFFMIFYNTKQYVLTKDISSMIIGHGGVIVDIETLDLYETGSARSPEYYLELFRKDKSSFEKMKLRGV